MGYGVEGLFLADDEGGVEGCVEGGGEVMGLRGGAGGSDGGKG